MDGAETSSNFKDARGALSAGRFWTSGNGRKGKFPMTRSVLTADVITAMALWIAWPDTSLAHGYLVRSFPAAKSHLTHSPHRIDLLFSLMMDPIYSVVQLQDEHGTVLAEKAQTERSRQFSMDAPTLQPGKYHLVYRMLAPDGDLLQGRVDFAVD